MPDKGLALLNSPAHLDVNMALAALPRWRNRVRTDALLPPSGKVSIVILGPIVHLMPQEGSLSIVSGRNVPYGNPCLVGIDHIHTVMSKMARANGLSAREHVLADDPLDHEVVSNGDIRKATLRIDKGRNDIPTNVCNSP